MNRYRKVVVGILFMALAATAPGLAQHRLVSQDRGQSALGLALRKLGVIGVFLQTTAHPDDENNGLIAMLDHGQGVRTILMTATRGNGGQNEIGPELFEDLAVVRTSELLAAHRIDGGEQLFTRAVDFGYSFSTEETLRKWQKDEILGDFVRQIRTVRPDVILAMRPDGEGGGQHHQTTAILTREAFRAAADPSRFPEQLKEGLRPWQPKKLYFAAGFGRGAAPPPDANMLRVDTSVYDPLLGRTYTEIGAEARSMHKCQGMGQLSPIAGMMSFPGAGPGGAAYRLADTTIPGQAERRETSIFDGIDTGIESLATRAGNAPPAALKTALAAVASQARAAQEAFRAGRREDVAGQVLAGLKAVRSLRSSLAPMLADPAARSEVDDVLALEEADFVQAALVAHDVTFEALADDGLVTRGQPLKLTLMVTNRGATPIAVDAVAVNGLEGQTACPAKPLPSGAVVSCTPALTVPAGAALTEAPYWRTRSDASRHEFDPTVPFGAPFRPTPFVATFTVSVGGVPLEVRQPIQYRYEANLFTGEKRMAITVVPAFSVRVSPDLVIIPAAAGPSLTLTAAQTSAPKQIVHVSVTSGLKETAAAQVTLKAPQGWVVTPPAVPMAFTYEDQTLTARFSVTAPTGVKPGAHVLSAAVASQAVPGGPFEQGYQVVEYPHFERRHLLHAATAEARVIDVRTPPAQTVGYIMGVGDVVPDALQALGAHVEFIDQDTLAWGDLARYPVIVTGVRAYERRTDLRTYNKRLLDYAQQGGTVIVQYNKTEFNDAQYGPYPIKVSSGRVTDEHAPIAILVPEHPVFNTPNKIGAATWAGWVQERGLYFLGDRDPQYVDLIELQDSFDYNKGVKRGALVEARVGQGRWLYVGLGLFRQVQAGTPGAYHLLANLLALGQRPAAGAVTP